MNNFTPPGEREFMDGSPLIGENRIMVIFPREKIIRFLATAGLWLTVVIILCGDAVAEGLISAAFKRDKLIQVFGWRHNMRGWSAKSLADVYNIPESTVRRYIDTYNQEKEQERTQNLLEKKRAIREIRFDKLRRGSGYNPALA